MYGGNDILSESEKEKITAIGTTDRFDLNCCRLIFGEADFQVADPWLIAAAKIYGYKIITFETGELPNKGSPSKRPKIPVVGASFGVKCESLFSYLRRMEIL